VGRRALPTAYAELNPPELPINSKSERANWVLVVRRTTGQGEFTFEEKVANPGLIPLEKGERFRVWSAAVLALLVPAIGYLGYAVLGLTLCGLALFVVFGGMALIYFVAAGTTAWLKSL
jgi:hypothetical protein